MANETTKYTHRIEKCCQLLKALCYVTLEKYTGDTLSCAYWRLREGKGLLTYEDKSMLDIWSKQITKVRRYCSSPKGLPLKEYEILKKKRNDLLEKMEKYRDWLAVGSKPIYLTDQTHHDDSNITLDITVTHLYPDIVCADIETQKEFWRSRPFDKILIEDEKIYKKLNPVFKSSQTLADAIDIIYEKTNYNFLPYNKVWQIRTDMERRSSKDAFINSTMNWMRMILHRCKHGHTQIILENERIINDFVEWKMKAKERINAKEKVNDDFFRIILNTLDKIQVPDISD